MPRRSLYDPKYRAGEAKTARKEFAKVATHTVTRATKCFRADISEEDREPMRSWGDANHQQIMLNGGQRVQMIEEKPGGIAVVKTMGGVTAEIKISELKPFSA